MTHMQKHPISNVSRRFLLKGSAAVSGLVLATSVGLRASMAASTLKSTETGAGAMPHGVVVNPKIFVSIAPDGTVTIIAHRSEMGTGVRTSLPMIVADEMSADWTRCHVKQAEGNEEKYGNQDTDGSRSTRHYLMPMRQIGAAARTMLETAAAKRWGVDVKDVRAENHEVVHLPDGKKLGFGELAVEAAALPVPALETLRLKDPSEFRYIGKGKVQIVDLRDITMGHATYGIDAKLPGMVFAVIARPPVVGGKLKSFDASEAMKIPGVEKVVEVKGWPWPSVFQPVGGVAVIARNTGTAIKGRDALKIEWEDGANAGYDSVAYRAELEGLTRKPGKVVRNEGDADKALAAADKVITAEYYVPHLAHVSMEPPAALAHWTDGKVEAWSCVQSAGGTRDTLAKTFNIPVDSVTVHPLLLGGGFGRKSKCDYVVEAALLAQTMGKPVKVVWTREDDVQHDFYHTVSAERIQAGIDKNGKVVAWKHSSAAPTIGSTFVPGADQQIPIELGMSLVDVPFQIPNIRCENPAVKAHTRIGWLRSVSNIPHGFAMQSMVGEIAHALGKDQKDTLLDLIGDARIVDPRKTMPEGVALWNYGEPFDSYPIDTKRLRAVVEHVAEKANWGKPMPKGHGQGIAVIRSFVSYVATVVEVAVDDKGNLSIPRVDTAIDCGTYVNPERIQSQIEGAAIMGISIAKYGSLTFKKGRVEQSNFDTFPVARIDDTPGETNVWIVPATWDVPPSGVGEPGVPPFAPALCNAIFAATGKRIRSLPIGDQLKA
jgi:isoquinoline 1-oxidoreductase beta subunit